MQKTINVYVHRYVGRYIYTLCVIPFGFADPVWNKKDYYPLRIANLKKFILLLRDKGF